MPSLRIDENEVATMQAQQRSRSPRGHGTGPPMSQISGVKRPLSHTNSFTGERLPTFGVDTPNEQVLGTYLGEIDTWGIDIFKIGELSLNRPLTCVAYTVFQVNETKEIEIFDNFLSFFFLSKIPEQRSIKFTYDTTENIYHIYGHTGRSLCKRQSVS